jgi:hypothetical protein
MAFTSLILTDACNIMTAEAWASSGVLVIDRVVVGQGFPGTSDYIPGYTGLKNYVMDAQIASVNDLVAGQITTRAQVSSANAPLAFQVNEIGVYATLNGGSPFFVAYMTTGAANGDTVTPTGSGTPLIKQYGILSIFSRAISTSGVIQLSQVVTEHAASHLNTGTDPIPVTSEAQTGLMWQLSGNHKDVARGDGVFDQIAYSEILNTPSSGMPILVNGNLAVNQQLGVGTFADNWKLQKTSGFTHVSATLNSWDNSFTPDAYFQTPPNFARIQATAANSGPGANDYAMATTGIEGCDFRTSYGNAVTVSALLRGSAAGSVLILLQTGGTPTQYLAYHCVLTTSFQRFFFTIPSWASQSLYNVNQQNQPAVLISVLCSGGSNYSLTSFNTAGWSASVASGSAFGLLQTNGAYVDIADGRWDVSAGISFPVFESYSATLLRCMRFQQQVSLLTIAVSATVSEGNTTFLAPFGATPQRTVNTARNATQGTAVSAPNIPGAGVDPFAVGQLNSSGGFNLGDAIISSITVTNLLF